MRVEFVVGSLPCSERFFSGYSCFLLLSKTNASKFQFDQVEEEPVCGVDVFPPHHYLLIYFVYFICGNSDVIATLVITNLHLYLIKRDLIQLWWQCFQISVFDDVVYAQTWGALTLKNPIEPPLKGPLIKMFRKDAPYGSITLVYEKLR